MHPNGKAKQQGRRNGINGRHGQLAMTAALFGGPWLLGLTEFTLDVELFALHDELSS